MGRRRAYGHSPGRPIRDHRTSPQQQRLERVRVEICPNRRVDRASIDHSTHGRIVQELLRRASRDRTERADCNGERDEASASTEHRSRVGECATIDEVNSIRIPAYVTGPSTSSSLACLLRVDGMPWARVPQDLNGGHVVPVVNDALQHRAHGCIENRHPLSPTIVRANM